MNEGKICWDFPLLGTGNQSGSNIAAITMFKGAGIMDGIGRENGQNSLDAKDKDLGPESPVRMQFVLEYINKADYPEVFDGYAEAVNNCRLFWEENQNSTPQIMEFISNIEKNLDKDRIPLLVVRDFNTTGLNGVDAGANEKSFWNLLVNTEGISVKQDKDSAGSYGIGKNAPFAYSGLNLIFYNTLAKDGGRAFEGVARLVTSQREYNGGMRPTQPIGKYLKLKDTFTGDPIIPSDNCKIANHPAFLRNEGEYGTDVGVVGFKIEEYPDWEYSLAVSMIKNFIMAIMNKKLIVEIKSPKVEYTVSSETIKDFLFDDFKGEEQLKYTRQIYETITEPDKEPKNFAIAEENDLTIYVKYKDSFSSSLSRFRSGGMLINTTTNDVYPHFSVVVVANTVGEKKLSEVLKMSEPPQHTEWKAKNITDNRTLHNLAAKYIREIGKKVIAVMDEYDDTEHANVLDSGTGDYVPDRSKDPQGDAGNDALRIDQKLRKIIQDGTVIIDKKYESGSNGSGSESDDKGHKAGKKKRRKRKKKTPIEVVTDTGTKDGVKPGSGKVKIKTPNITDHRTFYINDGVYKLFINSPEEYKKVFIDFHAGRDDEGEDYVHVSGYKFNQEDELTPAKGKIGPIELKQGTNELYLSFDNSEIMAVLPMFTMEVSDEE